MSPPSELPATQDLLIYFPAARREFMYYGDFAPNPTLRTSVLEQQHRYQYEPGEGERYAQCCGCKPEARYVVRARELPDGQIQYYLARFPNTARYHRPSCPSSKQNPRPPRDDSRPPPKLRPGDLNALFIGAHDPERHRVGVSSVRGSNPDTPSSGPSSSAASLHMLGRILLEEAGVCTCKPQYVKRRGFPEVNGLVLGALQRLRTMPDERYSTLLSEVPPTVPLGPWSLPHSTARDEHGRPAATLGFGFVVYIGPQTDKGSKEFTLANSTRKKLLVPASILAKAATIPSFPTDKSELAHPTWALFVAACFSGQWRAIQMTCFRMTDEGLVPVDSGPEERMVEHLIGEYRTFRRCLRPPEGGCEYVPDFVLQDTGLPHYIEVAGRDDKKYLRQLEAKRRYFEGRITIWRPHEPFPSLPSPSTRPA